MLFKPHKLWNLFVLALFFVSSVYGVRCFFEITKYVHLQSKVPCLKLIPCITSVKGRGYQLEVRYQYEIQQKSYEQSQKVSNRFFKNRDHAKEKYEDLLSSSKWIWFNEKRPDRGLLIKKIPLKNLFSSGLLISIALYFWVLGKYILTKKREE